MIHKLALYLTKEYCKIDNTAEFEKEIYLYAFENLLTQIILYSLLITISIFTKTLFCMITYTVFVTFLRGQTSGYHTKSRTQCIFLTIVLNIICGFLALILPQIFFYVLAPFVLVATVYIFIFSPINHKNLNLSMYEVKAMRQRVRYIVIVQLTFIIFFRLFPCTRPLSICGSLAIITVAFFMALSKIFNQEVKHEKLN